MNAHGHKLKQKSFQLDVRGEKNHCKDNQALEDTAWIPALLRQFYANKYYFKEFRCPLGI